MLPDLTLILVLSRTKFPACPAPWYLPQTDVSLNRDSHWGEWNWLGDIPVSWSHWSLLTRTAYHTYSVIGLYSSSFSSCRSGSSGEFIHTLNSHGAGGDSVLPEEEKHQEPGMLGIPHQETGWGSSLMPNLLRVCVSLDTDPALSSSADKYSVVVQYIVQSVQCRVQWSLHVQGLRFAGESMFQEMNLPELNLLWSVTEV